MQINTYILSFLFIRKTFFMCGWMGKVNFRGNGEIERETIQLDLYI